MEPVHPLDEDEELDALLDDAADGIDGHEMMKEDENNNNNKTHTCENIGHETKQALSNQEKAFDPLAGNGKKARKKRRQRKGKDSTTSGGGNATPAETDELRGEDARRENDEANGDGSPCGTKTESHAAFTKPEGGGVKKREEEEEEEERRRSGASAAAAGSLNRGAHASDNGSAGGDDAGVQNLVKRLRQIQTDARSAAGDSGADAAFGDAANMAEAGDSEEALASMLEQLASAVSAEGGDSDSDGMQSLVDAMMGQLLSKEVLYKPMMEIRDKYPPWLAENASSLPEDELRRYEQQHLYVCEVCTLFEEEEAANNSGLHKAKIMEVMQLMQECGQPPRDLVESLAPGMDFDDEGMPSMGAAGMGNACPMQ